MSSRRIQFTGATGETGYSGASKERSWDFCCSVFAFHLYVPLMHFVLAERQTHGIHLH